MKGLVAGIFYALFAFFVMLSQGLLATAFQDEIIRMENGNSELWILVLIDATDIPVDNDGPKPLEVVGNLVVSAKGGGESKEVSISCQVCGQRFTKQHHFQRHLFMHPDPDNKKFLCQVCGKRFNRADHLNRHALLHGDVRVQKCLLCGEEFDRASHLDRHRRKHHPPAGQQPSQTPPLTPQIKSPPPMGGAFDGIGFVTNIESPTTPMENQVRYFRALSLSL